MPSQIYTSAPLRAAVLGSTGSVGTQALDVMEQMGCEITLLSASRNVEAVAVQARRYHPQICTMDSEEAAADLRLALAGENIRVYGGSDAVCRAIEECGASFILHSIAGLAGLPAALSAASTGARIGMANKEALIAAGDVIYETLRRHGGEMIPVDSEHSAIFQCLCASGAASVCGQADMSRVKRILLTASGGPFFGRDRAYLDTVTAAQALAHPTWKMGPKITIDSATLMNKGFEVIEAVRLFGIAPEKIEVLVHRQSIIHSMVEYIDTSVIAQLSAPDMRHCIRYAASYPDRAPDPGEGLDFTKLGALTFAKPDMDTFPLLGCVWDVIRRGGIVPTALIAADEEAVAAFLSGRITMNQIGEVVAEVLAVTPDVRPDAVSDYYEAEATARHSAQRILARITK